MIKFKQFEFLEIKEFEQESFEYPNHAQNYYEVMFIRQGSGFHCHNGNKMPYTENDIFFISTDDHHYFEVVDRTVFFAIKFTDGYLDRFRELDGGFWTKDVRSIMFYKSLKLLRLNLTAADKVVLRGTMENVRSFAQREDAGTSSFVFLQLLSIFAFAKDKLNRSDFYNAAGHKYASESLVAHIHQHIYQPKLLTIKSLSSKFNISPNYMGSYFKLHFGMSIRTYITNYKIRLIRQHLQYSTKSLTAIAKEFGFVDDSHLSKFYQKHSGLKPSQDR